MSNPYLQHAMTKAEKKAYNHWYYEEHKDKWNGGRVTSYRPYYPASDVYGNSYKGLHKPDSSAIDRMKKANNRYYKSAFGENYGLAPRKWTLSPEYDKKHMVSRPGSNAIAYTVDTDQLNDPYRYIDSNIRYKQESDFYNTPENFSSDAAKRSYRRARVYADNEIAKTLKSYEKIRDQYTLKNDLKLAAAKGKNALRKAVKKLKNIKLSDIQSMFK